ncbi:hypothetical protein [Noviluteimonas gilva]|uniref:Uncharacterized protein n=1 Tax=Noviluteimonas gilva TaxID=2682097 RepID=A0A7C9HP82_9GAMM|nr:hypothetical protein [Lysobacter gilvus]MUV15772.1 hypothetical protein [Lysobacter gilvus]
MKDVTLYALVSVALLAAALAVVGLVTAAESAAPQSTRAQVSSEVASPHAMSVPF